MTDEPSQLEKLKEVARDLETVNGPARFKESLEKLVRHTPTDKPE